VLLDLLAVPVRHRNVIWSAAGYPPVYELTPLESCDEHKHALNSVVNAQQAFPVVAIDRNWRIIDANQAVKCLVGDVNPALLAPPVNYLSLMFHPEGLLRNIGNLHAWRAFIMRRLSKQLDLTRDPAVEELMQGIYRYPVVEDRCSSFTTNEGPSAESGLLELTIKGKSLSFSTLVAGFERNLNVELSEVSIESLCPVNRETVDGLISLDPSRVSTL
jgi:MmyB-like transcription regulator ligand binding domain